MSHFTTLRTRMVEKEYLLCALRDLELVPEEGPAEVRGFGSKRTRVEIKVPAGSESYDIGFRKEGDAYAMVADWWGIRDLQPDVFLQRLTQRYAYHAARAKLAEQGFDLVAEETQRDGQIHLVLRRMV